MCDRGFGHDDLVDSWGHQESTPSVEDCGSEGAARALNDVATGQTHDPTHPGLVVREVLHTLVVTKLFEPSR
jgi:hypothetical protein